MPRLYHTKSKTGCSRCRARRVKCDEGQPKCGTCTRHNVECNYDRTKSPGRDNAFFAESRERRYREMQLLHTFSSHLCAKLPGTALHELREMWGVEVPRLAMSCEPLLNAIFAFTCQYQAVKAKDDPKAAEKYLVWRSHYLEMSLPEHRQALGNITVKNADAMCLTTVLLNLGAVASLQDRQLVPYEPPTQWLQLLRSIGDVTAYAMDLLKDRPDSKFWLVIKTMLPLIHQLRDLDHSTSEYYSSLLRPTPEEMIGEADMEAYTETAKVLNWIYTSRQTEELLYARKLTAFPKILPAHFVTLVESRRPRAMAMLAHFFALATFASKVWWIGDMPYQELKAVQAELAGSAWEGIMAWPNEIAAQVDRMKTGTD